MLRNTIMGCLMLALLFSFSFAEEEDPVYGASSKYVIKRSDFDRQMSYLSADKQKHLQDNPQQRVPLIERMLQIKIIADLAREKGLDRQDDVKERMQYMIDDFLSREYLSNVVLKDITATEEDIEQYYKLNSDKFSVPEQVKVRHVLVKVSPDAPEEEKQKAMDKAKDVLKKAREGEDFAALAMEYSDDTGTRASGGELGFFGRGRMVKPFEDVAFSLKPGEISDIVETGFGYHVIKNEAYREAQTRPLEEVRDVIKKQVENELTRAKAGEFIRQATEEAGMKIYHDRITGVTSSPE